MGLLQNLPSAEQLTSILSPVLGDEAAGTGVAGVLKLLQNLNPSGISASLSANLDQSVSANLAADSTALTGSALDQFKRVMTSFPASPANLIAPVAAKLEIVRNLSSADLSTQLLGGINGLQNIETLIPTNTRDLVAGAADRLAQLKGEFISGAFGELRQWSGSVGKLYDEIAPLLTAGSGTLEARLIEYLRTKIADLVRILLPGEASVAVAISAQLDAAISANRLSEINAIKAGLINAMNLARSEFQNGNFSNTAHFAAAQAGFEQLTQALGNIASKLRAVFDQEIATAEGLARPLQRLFDDFAGIEITDLGNIRDKFAEAIGSIEEAIRGLDLNVVRETIDNVFQQINGVIGQFDLSGLTAKIAELKAQLQTALGAIDGALFEVIASIRNIFTQIREALRSVASAVGSYDENGAFHFHIQQDIENFLNGVKTTLRETIKPMLDQFKNTIGQTLQQVQEGLNGVKGEIESVKAKLESALQGVNQQLQDLDVAGKMEAIRQKLDGMLNGLGAIDFDPVVDPVVAEIDEMAGKLKQIDVSSLNEFTIGALKVSVEVVVLIDFSAQITDALMAEFDKLLEIPKGALAEVEGRVEGALKRFSELQLDKLLAPLDDLFAPITAYLDNLKLEALLAPLDAWHGRALQELDKVSPTALLQPLIDLHAQLQGALAAISPIELIRPLQETIDGVKAKIQAIDITGVATELSTAINRVKALLDEISPERLLNPLVNAFDKIMGALDRFDPGALLEPFKNIFEAILAPLDRLNADHVRIIGEVFSALRDGLNAFNPQQVFQTVQQKFSAVQSLMQQLNVGGLIAELRGPYDAMHASFEAGGGPVHVSLSASVEGLNPLRNAAIGQVVTDFQRFQTRLAALAQAQPPAELVRRYDEIKPKLESLIPSWANENISPASIKRAFQLANPLNLTAEINQLYDAIKQQLRNFDPRLVQENVKTTFDNLKNAIFAIDPEAIVGEVQGAIDSLTQRLDAIDLQLIANELEGLVDEVEAIINGFDPRPIIAQLQGLVDEVKNLFAELRPSEVLNELNAPFETSKEIVAAFDPASFKEPLQEVVQNIQSILEDVDVGVVLQPIVNRLDQLRDELEEGLKRTETAFNGMLQAIPV